MYTYSVDVMSQHYNCCIDPKCYIVFPTLQVNQCQVLLNVQLLEFQNVDNLETGNSEEDEIIYCCCESSNCSPNKTNIMMSSCSPQCDVFFNVMLSECLYPSGCFITTVNEAIINSPSVFYVGYNSHSFSTASHR